MTTVNTAPEKTQEILDAVTAFADNAHGRQTRKYTPERYIVHPVRVMKMCREYTNDIAVLCAALLHDVLEDTPVTAAQIEEFLSGMMIPGEVKKTIGLVQELTDVYVKKTYPQWNRRMRKAKEVERMAQTSGEAQTIKYADIIDNCKEIVAADPDFARVFIYECRTLLRKMDRGDPGLYQKAVDVLENCIRQLKGDLAQPPEHVR